MTAKTLIFNWKNNPINKQQALELLEVVQNTNEGFKKNVIISSPDIYLDLLDGENRQGFYKIASQNISEFDNGASTGEISGRVLKNFTVEYALVGHSETRENFRLSRKTISQKVAKALENKITPVLCVGYSNEKNPTGIEYKELKDQIKTGLRGVDKNSTEEVWIAYEPVWAIGTGKTASNKTIQNVIRFILDQLQQSGYQLKNFKIFYGGSVSEDNIQELNKISDLDGYLVGGASLKPEKIAKLIELV